MRYWIPLAVLSLFCAPASAEIFIITIKGTATTVEGDAPGDEIAVGDTISLSAVFDTASATLVAFGDDPTHNLYSGTLSDFEASVGAVTLSVVSQTNLTYWNDRFGMDAVTFGSQLSQAGPFGSSFGNLQFGGKDFTQQVFPNDSLSNGFPLANMEGYFFLNYGGDVGAKRIFGTVTASAQSLSAVPEPSTWAFMLIGFGVIGYSLRSTRNGNSINALRGRYTI